MGRNVVAAMFKSYAKEAAKAMIKGTPKAAQKYIMGGLKKDSKAFEKDRDDIDVATGEMSLLKYHKKHRKDYEKEDD